MSLRADLDRFYQHAKQWHVSKPVSEAAFLNWAREELEARGWKRFESRLLKRFKNAGSAVKRTKTKKRKWKEWFKKEFLPARKKERKVARFERKERKRLEGVIHRHTIQLRKRREEAIEPKAKPKTLGADINKIVKDAEKWVETEPITFDEFYQKASNELIDKGWKRFDNRLKRALDPYELEGKPLCHLEKTLESVEVEKTAKDLGDKRSYVVIEMMLDDGSKRWGALSYATTGEIALSQAIGEAMNWTLRYRFTRFTRVVFREP